MSKDTIKIEHGLARQLRSWSRQRKQELKRAIAGIDWKRSSTRVGGGVEAASSDGFFFVFRRPGTSSRSEIRLLDIKRTDELDRLSA